MNRKPALRRLGLFAAALLALAIAPAARAQTFLWAKQLGGSATDVHVDTTGNVYTVGSFSGTRDFDPGAGTFDLTSAGGNDVFVSKLDSAGAFIWARQLGGTAGDAANGVVVDASGNVYIVGAFQGTADFDPGAGTLNLTSNGSDDVFVTKLDVAGNSVWARALGGTSQDVGSGVGLDAAGHVYIAGRFAGTVDFDPGPGTFNLTSAGAHDAFVIKLDSAGNFVWAKQLGGTGNDQGLALAVDAAGSGHTVGFFSSTVDFDPGAGTFNLTATGSDVFVSKLDGAGNFVWAGRMEGDFPGGVRVDASGSVLTVGNFSGTGDFDPGPNTFNLTSAGGPGDVFISKLDSAGHFVWARRVGGTALEFGNAVAVDSTGNVYAVGGFEGVADFDPGPALFQLTSAGGSDGFVSKLDASGNFVGAGQLGGTSTDSVQGAAVGPGGSVHVVGNFSGTADLDPGPGTFNLSAVNGPGFVTKVAAAPGGDVSALMIGKSGPAQLALSWSASCSSGDDDYEVHEGTLGAFTSHSFILCSTGHATNAVITPAAGNRYYLVVPTDGVVEGSYGRTSAGVERTASGSACVPQSIKGCP